MLTPEEFERDLKEFIREELLAFSILQENRHRSVEPYEWFGPDDERRDAGPECECQGCAARFGPATVFLDSGMERTQASGSSEG